MPQRLCEAKCSAVISTRLTSVDFCCSGQGGTEHSVSIRDQAAYGRRLDSQSKNMRRRRPFQRSGGS